MGHVICVTGATSGIGRATALRFAKEGWLVIACGRRRERLDELREEIGPDCLALPLDVGDRPAVEAAFAALKAPFAPVDVLVNNAGLALGREPAQRASLDDWDRMVDTNIRGLIYCTRAVLPGMAARGRGHVVNIGSIAGTGAYPGSNVYGASKAFVQKFSQNLRCDLHGSGVRVTNVEPGLLESEFSLVRFKGDTAKAASLYDEYDPLRPEDIADVIYYVSTVPAHVNINRVEIMPACQSDGGTVCAPRAK
jgi:3-hydroxy acid dehydrogenase/malonic semialdehyde reductase